MSSVGSGAFAPDVFPVKYDPDRIGKDWVPVLKGLPLFEGMSTRHLKRIPARAKRFASGETIVRNLETGLARAAELGGTMRVGYLPDMFGHVAQMPQILRSAGIETAVVWRGVPSAVGFHRFVWESPDGSSVLAYRIPHEYCAPKDDIGEHVEVAVGTLPDDGEEWAVFYGVGNHGGGRSTLKGENYTALIGRPRSIGDGCGAHHKRAEGGNGLDEGV